MSEVFKMTALGHFFNRLCHTETENFKYFSMIFD